MGDMGVIVVHGDASSLVSLGISWEMRVVEMVVS